MCQNNGAGTYSAYAMPACARLAPETPYQWLLIEGRREVIRATKTISAERREYLLRRCDDWDDWAKRELRADDNY